jgi:uncharacterized membrane protein
MKAQAFLDKVHHGEISAAIGEAEQKTSGEIRVFISRKPVETPVAAAQDCFVNLGMEKTRDRNAVLIFVAPRSQNFAVIGDVSVHRLCGDSFWIELAEELGRHFRQSEFTAGLVQTVRRAGDLLARHFPRKPDDQNELPDEVIKE